jgi:hypothetical protein
MRRTSRLTLSIVAGAAGWLAGTVVLILTASFVWRDVSELGFVIAWTVPFALLAWCLIFLPVTLLLPSQARVFSFPDFAVVSAFLGVIAFLASVGWWAPIWRDSYVYLIHPGIAGFVAGAVFSLGTQEERPSGGAG